MEMYECIYAEKVSRKRCIIPKCLREPRSMTFRIVELASLYLRRGASSSLVMIDPRRKYLSLMMVLLI